MASEFSYWRKRMGRRGALAVGGAAAFVAACGGSDDKETTSATTVPAGRFPSGVGAAAQQGQPKLGGTLRYHIDKDPGNLRPAPRNRLVHHRLLDLTYNGMLRFRARGRRRSAQP